MIERPGTNRRTVLAAGVGALALSMPSTPSLSSQAMAATAAQSVPGSRVFARGEEDYDTFRIPAVIRAANGDLLAFAEGRVNNPSDDGDIDLVMRRSVDDGVTWEPEIVTIWDDGPNKVGNPVPVVDQATGDIVLLVIRTAGHVTGEDITTGRAIWEESRRPFVLRSRDHGVTWDDPVEITDAVKPPHWRHFVFGPGHAIQLTRGTYQGRIVVPGNHTSAPPAGSGDTGGESRYAGVHLAYSDDGGFEWKLGAVDEDYDGEVNGNESQLVELTDGTLYQSIRDQKGDAAGNRAYALSSDGGESYDGPLVPEPALETPVIEGSVQRLYARDEGDDSDVLLFSAPEHPENRVNMTIWRSDDEGRTWTVARNIWSGPSGYSDLIKLSDERVGLLYEAGPGSRNYEEISFARVLTDRLT